MAKDSTTNRLGVGEYDTVDGLHTRLRSQRFFLHRAANLVPELLPSLAEAIEPLPAEALEWPDDLDDGGGYERLAEGVSRFEQFRASITQWQDRWNLTDDWIPQELHSALCWTSGNLRASERVSAAWTWFALEPVRPFSPIYPPTGGLPGTTGFKHTVAKPLAPLFVFRARWYAQYEFRADISRWLRRQFEKELTAYLNAVENQMKTAGLVRTSTKRPRRSGDPLQHFDWLVRFQVQCWTQARIARENGHLDISTVAQALRSTAEHIDLTRRSTSTPK